MTEQTANERELAQFLEATYEQELSSWKRERTESELGSFVDRRLDLLDDVDL